ncbi:uncharacterized protein L3040_004096 [Drepanopeziza brunnea f. sp. 'multigermtubi']|uniref:Uncharacterized protein n=1 Tax=Marssonina brunnea f. sp. multigermtubi (strain MB_m1) TaxID=1072389 RepID=K1X0W3_MARBU|nr:uncharacterized protein MBM_03093 [Drepanopeziza brunnea f. sp. 'multigermtubi' MB_m1]EKD18851.1 hypothetical protein MBM_03093 [Drepanopeziza brunnea f. sp. 'multigermtubi' MB_m1]KAJ5042697.1 hypothetical protein L3040_004096 [Drepanopeziza brunnea f. sp. 'multigermtubi']
MALSSTCKRLLRLLIPSAPAENASPPPPPTLAEQIERIVTKRRRPSYLTAKEERNIFVRKLASSRALNEIQINVIVTALGEKYPTVESLLVAVRFRKGQFATFYPSTTGKRFYPYDYPRRPGPRVYDGLRPSPEEKKLLGTLYNGGVTDEWLAKDFVAPLRDAATDYEFEENSWWQARGYHCEYHYLNQVWDEEITRCYCGGRNIKSWRWEWSGEGYRNGEEYMAQKSQERGSKGRVLEQDISIIQYLDGSRWNAPFGMGSPKA